MGKSLSGSSTRNSGAGRLLPSYVDNRSSVGRWWRNSVLCDVYLAAPARCRAPASGRADDFSPSRQVRRNRPKACRKSPSGQQNCSAWCQSPRVSHANGQGAGSNRTMVAEATPAKALKEAKRRQCSVSLVYLIGSRNWSPDDCQSRVQ